MRYQCNNKECVSEIKKLRLALAEAKRQIRLLKKKADPLTRLPLLGNFGKDAISRIKVVEEKRRAALSDAEHTPHRVATDTHTIAFVDLDGLYWVNKHGERRYETGDHVLVSLANILDRWRRRDDLVFRRQMGGDEFILLFPASSAEDASRLLRKNRERFEKVIAQRFPPLEGKVSFTFGVEEVSSSATEEMILDALDRASQSMHENKDRRKMERRGTNLLGESV